MEPINPNILNASLGQFVGVQSPLTDWPDETLAYYSEVNPEDLREGMEGIIHVLDSVPKSSGRYSSKVTNEMGTIHAVEFKNDDPTNMYMSIVHRMPADIDHKPSARQYSTFMETANWIQGGKFFQRHSWVRVQPEVLENLPFAGVEGLVLQSHRWDDETIMSLTIDSIKEDNWLELQETHKIVGDKGALYFLHPKPAKVLRQAEAIPPMPGEKPQPGDAQPGEQPGDGNGKPEDDIPPMPGESRQSVDKDKKGPTVQLEDGWWGTGRGEN